MIWRTDTVISIGCVAWIIITETCSSLICDSGHCIFDCRTQKCTEIVCTDTADSCTIHCGESDCYHSTFYLSAKVNTVDCTGPDSCKSAHFYCGIPNTIPSGFSETNFDAHINSCVFTLTHNAMPDHGLVSCYHDIDFCLVQTQSDNDDFKESTFECETSPSDSQCILQCYNDKSCGSKTSHFTCNSPRCQCTDRGGNSCTDYIHQNMNYITDTSTTSPPTSSPTHNMTQSIHQPVILHDENTGSPSMAARISTLAATTDSVVSSNTEDDTFASIMSTSSPTTNNRIIAFAPTRPVTVASHIYSTWIRREKAVFIPSTTSTEIDDDHRETQNVRILSDYGPSTWIKICVGLFCGILIFSFLSVAGCCKIYKERKQSKQQDKQERITENNDNQYKEYKASTIDLAVVHIDTTNVDIKEGEEVSIDGLYDINLDDDEETSDDETLSGDGNPFETMSCDVAALCNVQSIEIAPVSFYSDPSLGIQRLQPLVINPNRMQIAASWNTEDESDDELEEMYSNHDTYGNGYSNGTMCIPYLQRSSLET
eukprot:558815_1